MPIFISLMPESLKVGVDIEKLEQFTQKLTEILGLADAELSLVLTDDATIKLLNREWRNKDRPTDVLSFPQDCPERVFPKDFAPQKLLEEIKKTSSDCRVLGDVVVSVDTAGRQAESFGWSLEEELKRLILHGLVHLLGYDHERSKEEEEKFRSFERFLWEKVEGKPFFG